MKEKANTTACDLTGQAFKTCDQAIQHGLKLQEEARQCWATAFTPSASTWDWQDQFSKIKNITAGIQPRIRKQTEEAMAVMDKTGKMENELLQKATEAVEAPKFSESHARWMEFWKLWMESIHKNAEHMIQLDGRIIDLWLDFTQKRQNIEQSDARKKA